jgi:outer membrane protein assembly factor BamA
MRKRATFAICAFAFGFVAFGLEARSYAQSTSSPSAILGEIHATGSRRYGDTQVAAAVGIKPGDAITREQIQQIADRLSQTGLFSRVNYDFTSKGNKIALVFELADAPTVPVSFDNFVWFTQDELSAAIRDAVPIYDGNAPKEGRLVDDMTTALTKLLADRGVAGNVTHALIAQPTGNDLMMQFRVEGPAFTIDSIGFSDSLAQVSEKLRDRKSDLIGKPFSRYAIDVFENEQVRPIYLSTGHVRVRFGAPLVRQDDEVGKASSQASGGRVPVTLEIDPGPVFSLGGFAWSAAKALDEKTLASLVVVRPGEQADGMRLAAGWQRIEDEYARRGFLDAKVTPEPAYDDAAAKVTYQVAIDEGPQYRMGAMVITGLSLDAEKRLRAAWQIPPGQVFDRLAFDDLLTKIEKPTMEIFSDIPVHYAQMGHWLRTDPDKHTVDVLLDFQ